MSIRSGSSCADFEAGLAVDDAVVGGFFARLACVRDGGDRGVDPDGGEDAFEDAIALKSGLRSWWHEETADLLRSARPKILQNSIFRQDKRTEIEFCKNFGRVLPLQGLAAIAGGRLYERHKTGMVRGN